MARSKKKTEKLLKKYIRKWEKVLLSSEWKVDVYFEDELEPTEHSKSPVAGSYSDWRNCYASMQFDLGKLKKYPDIELEDTVVHEMLHILLSGVTLPYDEWTRHYYSLEERLVVFLTRAILRVSNGEA